MPSSGKTANLGLNKWLGSDKPKKDDFNLDNQKIDEAWKALNSSLGSMGSSLSAHTAGAASHITGAERSAWNAKDKCVLGSYPGDGANTRKITLGFQLRFGFLFAVAAPIVRIDPGNFNSELYAGFLSAAGSSKGIAVDAAGFTVTHHASQRPDGLCLKYNDPAYTYYYAVWP